MKALIISSIFLVSCSKNLGFNASEKKDPEVIDSNKENDNPSPQENNQRKSILHRLNPTMVVKYPDCMLCHAVIQGNLITDYSIAGDLPQDSSNSILIPTHAYPNNVAYLSEYAAMTTLFVPLNNTMPTIYVPQKNLSTTTTTSTSLQTANQPMINNTLKYLTNNINTLISPPPASGSIHSLIDVLTALRGVATNDPAKTVYNYLSSISTITRISTGFDPADFRVLNSPTNPTQTITSLKDFLITIQNNRSNFYIKALLSISDLPKSNAQNQSNFSVNVVEMDKLSIGNFSSITLPPVSDSLPTGIIPKPNASQPQYYVISSTNPIACEGTISLNAPLVLHNPTIKTNTGCRIYSTKSIFINYPSSSFSPTTSPEGINLISDPSNSIANLQLFSQVAIVIGLGKCNNDILLSNTDYNSLDFSALRLKDSLIGRLAYTRSTSPGKVPRWVSLSQSLLSDYKLISAENILDISASATASSYTVPTAAKLSGNPIFCDAFYNDLRRNVKISKIALFAPMVHSRLTGNLSGLIIAEFLLGSLGNFTYKRDDIFSNPKVLLYPEIIEQLNSIIPNSLDVSN